MIEVQNYGPRKNLPDGTPICTFTFSAAFTDELPTEYDNVLVAGGSVAYMTDEGHAGEIKLFDFDAQQWNEVE